MDLNLAIKSLIPQQTYLGSSNVHLHFLMNFTGLWKKNIKVPGRLPKQVQTQLEEMEVKIECIYNSTKQTCEL